MAEDAALETATTNPCCAELKRKCAKLEESRNVLRRAVKILDTQFGKIERENINLKKDYDKEHKQAKLENEDKIKESCIRHEMEKELNELKAEISSYQQNAGSRCFNEDEVKHLKARIIEIEAERNGLRELLEKERRRCYSEKKKAELERKKTAEANKLLAAEKSKAERDRTLAETERKKAEECRQDLEKLKSEAKEFREKLILEKSKTDNAIKKVELEKKKTQKEKMRANSERLKAEEQMKLIGIEREKAVDEKVHIECLSQQLKEEKQRTKELLKKIEEIIPAQGAKCSSSSIAYSETANIQLLREQLMLEKKHVKYAKRMTQLEKSDKSFIGQQVNILKQEFINLSSRLDMLALSLSRGTEGEEEMAKVMESPELLNFSENKVFGIKPCNFSSKSYVESMKYYSNPPSNYSDSTKECRSSHLSDGFCTRPISGINSELESPIRDSIRNKSQSSAVCSNTHPFSDRTLMGSQGRNDLITRSTKFTGSSLKHSPTIQKKVGEVGKSRQNENSKVITGTANTSSVQRKKRRIDETLESIAWLCYEDKQLHLKLDEKLSLLRNSLSIKDGLTRAVTSRSFCASDSLETGRGLLVGECDDMCKWNSKCDGSLEEQRQQKLARHILSQSDNQKQTDISESEGIKKPCFFSETTAPHITLQRDGNIKMNCVGAVSSEEAALVSFDNVNHGSYLKLLELDNDDDERRYRAAMEVPLSPTLPEISSPRVQFYGEAVKQMPLPTIRKSEYQCKGNGRIEHIPTYCVIFSNAKEDSISRIIHLSNALLCQDFIDEADCVTAEMLHYLKSKEDLLPEEKVSVCFSLLLYNVSGTPSSNSKRVTSGDILRLSESFSTKFDRVISDGKTGWLFQEIYWLEILLNLIEEFLVGRRVLMYNSMQSERSYPYVSSCVSYRAEDKSNLLTYGDATVDQLVAASTILACICDASNHIGFLLEASYKILRRCRSDTSCILFVLHAFAYVIGDKLFSLSNYSFLITAIKSLISLLERGLESLSPARPNLHSAYDACPSFSPCEQCPFHENAISEENCISLLLDALHDSSSRVRFLSSARTVPPCVETDEQSTDRKHKFDGSEFVCDSSCILFKCRKFTDRSDNISNRDFCHYTDIVSLVELVGCYVNWEWTSNNMIPRLLVMLESHISEEFSAAIFVLIGQLARSGINAGGYQQSGVRDLRCSLSRFLDALVAGKGSFPTQFAAVGTLLNLLPSSFENIVDGYVEHSVTACESRHMNLIQQWFLQLSTELQSLASNLFRSTDQDKF